MSRKIGQPETITDWDFLYKARNTACLLTGEVQISSECEGRRWRRRWEEQGRGWRELVTVNATALRPLAQLALQVHMK